MKTTSPQIWFSLLVLIVLSIFLSACGPSQAELDATATQGAADNFATQTAQAPTATATFTPSPTATATFTPSPTATATPTSTPIPTLTPTPPPTNTPTPTTNPLAGVFAEGKLVMTDESYKTLKDIGLRMYSQGFYFPEIALYDAMLEYSLQPDQIEWVYRLQSEDYEKLGQYDLAIENYLRILDLGIRRPTDLNGLCWDYAITNRAEEALPYCEEVVTQDPSCAHLDSRGVVYALLGRYPEAVSDFEAALELGYPSDTLQTQRQEWVTTLQAGNNPITPAILKQERNEEIPLTSPPWYTGDLQLSYLRAQFEEEGFVFEETTIDGQAGLIGTLQEGNCTIEIVLLGDEQEFKGGSSTILGCSHGDISGHVSEFIDPFARDENEFVRAFVWQSADVYYVIEGKPVTDLTPIFGGFQFTVERTNEAGNDGIIVTAKPAE